ncbi:P-loop ATPase, Sll1717 family [Paenibacillus xylanivorans]|uniref:ATPase n=1 Tax=Paenibacillus xylanivorans TaxID=1705561 RepID=A0A0M9BLI1_9BACL|nr:hypothetical protein [Paenibacillus xylanivorans]KOY13886.1 hypothetical protein AMS66_23575 [Paenibacillus xylanivorans]
MLKLSDLYLGDIDAKYELLSNSPEEKDRFVKSFLIPENVIIEHFLTGRKYYITGLKGTGKTALLRYISISAEKAVGAATSFILFKTQFSEDDRKDLTNFAGATVIDTEDIPDDIDYENIWRWYIHRHIVQQIIDREIPMFVENREWNKYKTCVLAPKLGNEDSGIASKLPKIKNGSIELGAGLTDISGKLGLEFEYDDNDKTKVKFNSIVRQADNLFNKLSSDIASMLIFIDELELSHLTKNIYERDIKLIRDLIIAVEQFNTLCKESSKNIKIICAVRSEVLSAISSSGKEINKPVSSFGVPVIWHQSGGDILKHPILKILVQRIISSESVYNEKTRTPIEVWNKWFPDKVQSTRVTDYILHRTWYRPRDIIRLLTLAQNQFPSETKFSHKVFDGIRKQYSIDSWTEMAEELRATYNQEEIDGIRRLLYGYKPYFIYKDFQVRSEELSITYDSIKILLDNHRLSNIVIHLFRIGIIGNVSKDGKNRWAFRGDDEVILEKRLAIHRALWQYLSV